MIKWDYISQIPLNTINPVFLDCLWKGIKEVNFPTISVWGKQGEEPDYTQTQSSNKRHYKA